MVLWQNPDADPPRYYADNEGENDRRLSIPDTKPRLLKPGITCQIEIRLIHHIAARFSRRLLGIARPNRWPIAQFRTQACKFGVTYRSCLFQPVKFFDFICGTISNHAP